MRALGFYPTKFEINRMCNEVKYADFTETGKLKRLISLDDFIKLYVNHRPVFGVGKEDIAKAFNALSNGDSKLNWKKLLDRLQVEGERLSKQEIAACMQALTGSMEMAENMDASMFSNDILGFTDVASEAAE